MQPALSVGYYMWFWLLRDEDTLVTHPLSLRNRWDYKMVLMAASYWGSGWHYLQASEEVLRAGVLSYA